MALVARVQIRLGHDTIVAHPDFAKPYWKHLLSDPHIEWKARKHNEANEDKVSNSMFEWTLYGERGIKAHLSFRRPCKEPDSIKDMEECFLMSIGDALDGKTGRAHGGLASIILDHISGASHNAESMAYSTARV